MAIWIHGSMDLLLELLLELLLVLLLLLLLHVLYHVDFEGAHTGQTFLEISNGRKTVRMAPILMIFGPNESQRCQLNFANISRC